MPARDNKLYVGGLSASVTHADLEKEFGHYGRISEVWVARNPPGFAFVTFHTSRAAAKALQSLNGRKVFGGKILVELSNNNSNRSPRKDTRGPLKPRAPKKVRQDILRRRQDDSGAKKMKTARMAHASKLLASAKRTRAKNITISSRGKKTKDDGSMSPESHSPRQKSGELSQGGEIRPLMEGFTPRLENDSPPEQQEGNRDGRRTGRRFRGRRDRKRPWQRLKDRRNQGGNAARGNARGRPGRRRSLSPRQRRGRSPGPRIGRPGSSGRWADVRHPGQQEHRQSFARQDAFASRFRGRERGRAETRQWPRERAASPWSRDEGVRPLLPMLAEMRSGSPTTRQRLASATSALLRSTVGGKDSYLDTLMAERGFRSRRELLNTIQPLIPSLLAGAQIPQLQDYMNRGRERSPPLDTHSWAGRSRSPLGQYGGHNMGMRPQPLLPNYYGGSHMERGYGMRDLSPPRQAAGRVRASQTYSVGRDRSPVSRNYNEDYGYMDNRHGAQRTLSPQATSAASHNYSTDYRQGNDNSRPFHPTPKSKSVQRRGRSPSRKHQQSIGTNYQDSYETKARESASRQVEPRSDYGSGRYEDNYSSKKRTSLPKSYSSHSPERNTSALPRSYRDPSPQESHTHRPPSPPAPRPRTPSEPRPRSPVGVQGYPASSLPAAYNNPATQNYISPPKPRAAPLVLRHRSATPEEYIPRSKKLAMATQPRPHPTPSQQQSVQPLMQVTKPKPVRYDFITARKRKAMISRNRPRN